GTAGASPGRPSANAVSWPATVVRELAMADPPWGYVGVTLLNRRVHGSTEGGRMSRQRNGGRRTGRKVVARLVEEEIVRAAAVCFGGVGYHATTLETIAARGGVSKVTLYPYVSSKEGLL